MFALRVISVSALLMFAIGCGGDSSSSPAAPSPTPSPAPTSDGASSTVTIPMGAEALGNRAFNPDEVNVAVGGTVTWVNADKVSHTSTSNATGWNSGTIAAGQQFATVFPTAGTFPYHCTIHPGMVGTVVVR
jgi:plastocyanin